MIPVAEPYFPDREKLLRYIDGIHTCHWLANPSPLAHHFERVLWLPLYPDISLKDAQRATDAFYWVMK